jgi:GT2 family glycosyltransferase
MIKDTAILITTFLRDDALFKCILSIRKLYPDIAIFVADTGHESSVKDDFCSSHNCELFKVTFDAGVCVARNEGFSRIPDKYKYIFVSEDDIIFTRKTKLEMLRDVLEKRKQAGIAGCSLRKVRNYEKKSQEYEASLRIADNTIYVEKVDKPQWRKLDNARYFYCDIITNVFLMRRDIWKKIKWDERYRTTPEHTDYFLLLKHNTDWKVAFTDSVSMEHHVQEYKEHTYLMKRTRTDGYRLLASKWGVNYYWNSWHKKWGIDNPMGLYTYAKLRPSEEAKRVTSSAKGKEVDVAIGIKTFMREENFFKVIDSIEKFFPYSYRLYIADDSGSISDEKEYLYQQLGSRGHVIMRLPFNGGLSVGRNAIIRQVKEKYVLIMDDDICLVDADSIKKMKKVLDSAENIGLCAGVIYQENGEYFGGEIYSKGLSLEIDRSLLFRHRATKNLSKVNGIIFNYADQVVNFFLAKSEVFKDISWDNRIKVEYEHIDFFLRLKETRWKAVVCMGTKLVHFRPLGVDSIYNGHRKAAPLQYFYQKHRIGNIVNRYLQQVGRR